MATSRIEYYEIACQQVLEKDLSSSMLGGSRKVAGLAADRCYSQGAPKMLRRADRIRNWRFLVIIASLDYPNGR